MSDRTRGAGGSISHVETDRAIKIKGGQGEFSDKGGVNEGPLGSRVDQGVGFNRGAIRQVDNNGQKQTVTRKYRLTRDRRSSKNLA